MNDVSLGELIEDYWH